MRAADARGGGGKRHSRGRALCPTSVIPADAGTQRKTKHATTPFATRRGRERAKRCERGMPGAAGVNVIPAEGRCAQRPSSRGRGNPEKNKARHYPLRYAKAGIQDATRASKAMRAGDARGGGG